MTKEYILNMTQAIIEGLEKEIHMDKSILKAKIEDVWKQANEAIANLEK